MKIKTILNRIGQSFIAVLIAGSCLTAPIVMAGEGALLELTPAFPKIDYTGTAGQGCVYDADNDLLTITGTPGFTAFGPLPAGPVGFVLGGLVTMTLNIDDAGTLSGGSFSVTGSIATAPGPFATPLLTGTFTGGDYGIVNQGIPPGTTDQADARAVITGGSMAPLYAGNDIGITITMENSTEVDGYDGTMTADWACARAKGVIGPVPPPVAQGCTLSIDKTASTGTVGPHTSDSDHDDTDSDSGRDHNDNGDSDDSDSDSEADSEDSGHMPPNCGCKGKVKNLTMRWNSTETADVVVMNKKMTQTYFDGMLVPGEEFDLVNLNAKKLKFFVNGGAVATLKLKCNNPVGTGQVIGDFVVVDGYSKFGPGTPLCPFPGTTCGPEFEVTYDYTVTNNGPATAYDVVVSDDQLGVIGTLIPSLGNGASEMFSVTTCIFDTTWNTATATGNTATGGAGEACDFDAGDPPTNTAHVELLPPPCGPDDSDSDSHSDHDGDGDTDNDSDSDSGHGDCDGDGT